ncbi:MAG TPA: NCS1 family nucleobase:cation symporter-1, partial [Ktedonobacteraceae bacterium]|nr:NCS1 family nucleobase:cation symporter-1 [Ktedonobacteraceae bacterium]
MTQEITPEALHPTDAMQHLGVPPGASPRLFNEDLAPARERRWGTYSVFALWMSDVHNIGNYTFASGLFVLGLAAWQVLVALVIGILVVFVGMNLMGFLGEKNGIPFPVVARISFGVFGANLPALIRGIIAILWYGIQTFLASVALVVLLLRVFPGLTPLSKTDFLGLSYLGWICFLTIWALQLIILSKGMETVRRFQDWCGPIIWLVMICLAIWLLWQANFQISLTTAPNQLFGGDAIREMFAAAGLTVATYGTLMLNFCDFSRFSPNRRSIVVGNFWGLPVNFTAFAIAAVIVTAASIKIYGQAIPDPALLVAKVPNTLVLLTAAVLFTFATIGVNIVANFVSPAYDLANVAPKYITFKRGGVITAIVAVLVLPWNLYSNPAVISYFLGGLGAFLGPLFGIIMVDYYLIRRA